MNNKLPHSHGGHRARMRAKLANNIGHTLTEHELLEMLLYYLYPRCDTNEKAHRLLDSFGGKLCNVIDADSKQLINAVLTETSASFFQLFREVFRVYSMSKIEKDFTFENRDTLHRYSAALITNPNEEEFYVICFDSRGRRICDVPAAAGAMRNVQISMRKMMDIAVKNNAYSVVLVHNHPNGMTTASMEDIKATQYIEEVFRHVNISVADHIIVTNGGTTSMRESGSFEVKLQEDKN